MFVIELHEYESWIGHLPEAQRDELMLLAGSRLQFAPRVHGEMEISATEHAGVFVTRDVTVRVRPKVPLENLFFMLDAGAPRWQIDRLQAPFAVDTELTTAVVRLFALEVDRITSRGLLHGYVEHQDRQMAMRGRLDLHEIIRRPWEQVPIACRYDEFVPDVFVNRALRTALEAARLVPDLPTPVRGELHLLLQRFDAVAGEPIRVRDIDRWRPSRADRHYATALGLARIILHNLTLADRAGTASASSFTIDMNQLFEDFLGRELGSRLPPDLALTEQHATHLALVGSTRRLPMRPDFVFHPTGIPHEARYVADAKYKLTETLGSNADHYQLLAYLTRLGLHEGVLVYCQAPDEIETPGTDTPWSTIDIVGSDRQHHVYRLDVSGDRQLLSERLDALVHWLVTRIGGTLASPSIAP